MTYFYGRVILRCISDMRHPTLDVVKIDTVNDLLLVIDNCDLYFMVQ